MGNVGKLHHSPVVVPRGLYMKTVIWHLVKFFNQEKYADEFIKGNLHLNRLSYFRKLEESDDGRPDSHEALTHWWQPDDFVMKLNVPGHGEVEIKKEDLAGPVSMHIDYHHNLHVYCMYAMRTIGFDCKDGQFECSPDEVEIIKKQLEVDERNFGFGNFAVVVRATEFIERLNKVLRERGQAFVMDLVEYYDDETFHGEIQPKKVPFMKQKKFSYQNEFRVCLDTKTVGDEPLNIAIGDVSDISAKIEPSKLNGMYEFQTKQI